MRYQSTRGRVDNLTFREAVMMGLAVDGGLLVPHQIPDVRAVMGDWHGLDYASLAFEVMRLFIDDIDDETLRDVIERSYGTFDDPAVTPLRSVGDVSILELFHGPTLAFKDVALQFLGNVFELILSESQSHLNILGATSGDTGSAAIAGVRGKDRINIFVLYPDGKTSRLQERQMTTVLEDNVHNIALRGSFDDCQTLMKSVFSDLDFKEKYHLGAVNSVNWARVLAQIVYYFSAWHQLGMPAKFNVSVPTGNFGDIFAGYLALRMGLPIHRLILATNSNDILARFFNSGRYARGEVSYSESPAMDIQVSSNFERYLFYRLGESGDKVADFMQSFSNEGAVNLHYNTPRVDEHFRAASASDEQTLNTIAAVYRDHQYLVDPHTAVGVHVGRRLHEGDIPLVCLATAHPAKFDAAMSRALPGVEVSHPTLTALSGLPERKQVMEVDEDRVKGYLVAHSG
ncbi:MAG: threonine synthase [Proteobacteria bacterium]|nr:threonine synthase [Pseudomonadota bacterium]